MKNLNYKKEVWKDIPEYEGYQVSNLGRVKSLERIDARGHKVKEKLLKPNIVRRYYRVVLYKNSIKKKYYVHRLVWIAFNGQMPEGYEVNHINEITTDNRLSNLNLMTHKENINWGTAIERSAKKKINGKKSKPVLWYDLQDNFIKEFPSLMQVYRELGFNQHHICECCNGKLKTAYGYKWRYKG